MRGAERPSNLTILVAPALARRGQPAAPLGRPLEGYTPLEDATAVRLLQAAGADIVGPPKSAELAFGLAGDTTVQTLKETGATAAIGLDTLGEIRLAAAASGLVGYKPSWGIFSRSGLIGLVPSMEAIGVIAEQVSPIKKIAGILASPDPADFSMLQKDLPAFLDPAPTAPPKLGLIGECLSSLLPEESRALSRAVKLLEERGYTVREVSLPGFDLFPLVHQIVGSVEASSSAGNYDGVRFGRRVKDAENWNEMYLKTRGENFSPLVKSYLFQGAYFQFQDYEAFENACRIRRRLVKETANLFQEIDFLILPALRPGRDPRQAKTVAEIYQTFAHTLPASVLGVPAVTLPGFVFGKDRDLSLQLLAPHLRDPQLLNFASQLSQGGATPVSPSGEKKRR